MIELELNRQNTKDFIFKVRKKLLNHNKCLADLCREIKMDPGNMSKYKTGKQALSPDVHSRIELAVREITRGKS